MIKPIPVDFIADRSRTASALPFQSILGLTTNHLFGQLCGIVFCHTSQKGFHQNALRAFGNRFHNGNQVDAILFQDHLVVCTIKTIPGKAVKFPDENNIKQLLAAVFDHLLELRAVVRLGRECTVNVVFDDRDTVFFRIGRAFPNLSFDGFFALVIAGIAGVNYGGHRFTSFFLSNRRVAFCILVNLPCTVKAHFAGVVVFEPCIHVARIQSQVRVETIICQFLFLLKFQYPAMD